MEERNAGVLPAPNGAGPSPIPAANTRRRFGATFSKGGFKGGKKRVVAYATLQSQIPAAGLAPPFLKVALELHHLMRLAPAPDLLVGLGVVEHVVVVLEPANALVLKHAHGHLRLLRGGVPRRAPLRRAPLRRA